MNIGSTEVLRNRTNEGEGGVEGGDGGGGGGIVYYTAGVVGMTKKSRENGLEVPRPKQTKRSTEDVVFVVM